MIIPRYALCHTPCKCAVYDQPEVHLIESSAGQLTIDKVVDIREKCRFFQKSRRGARQNFAFVPKENHEYIRSIFLVPYLRLIPFAQALARVRMLILNRLIYFSS